MSSSMTVAATPIGLGLARRNGVPIDFSQEIHLTPEISLPLGKLMYDAIGGAPVKLDVPNTVAFGTFANAVVEGGMHDISHLDRDILTEMIACLRPPFAVHVYKALDLLP